MRPICSVRVNSYLPLADGDIVKLEKVDIPGVTFVAVITDPKAVKARVEIKPIRPRIPQKIGALVVDVGLGKWGRVASVNLAGIAGYTDVLVCSPVVMVMFDPACQKDAGDSQVDYYDTNGFRVKPDGSKAQTITYLVPLQEMDWYEIDGKWFVRQALDVRVHQAVVDIDTKLFGHIVAIGPADTFTVALGSYNKDGARTVVANRLGVKEGNWDYPQTTPGRQSIFPFVIGDGDSPFFMR